MDLLKAVGFVTLAILALIVAPIAGVIISVAVGIWFMYMVFKEEESKND